MSAPILIRPHPNDGWQWHRAGAGGGEGDLDAFAAWAGPQGGAETVLLVPGERVLLTEAEMPSTDPARIAKALPFALEEQLVEEPERVHCAAGPWVAPRRLGAAAVRASELRGWLDALAAAGVEPAHAVPDTLCLPWRDGELHLARDGARTLLRWGECRAQAIESDTADALCEMISSRAGGLRRVDHGDGGLGALADGARERPLDLLQGPFLPRALQAGWRRWRVPAALAAAAVLLLLGGRWAETRQLEGRVEALQAQVRSGFAEVFPEVRRVQADPGPQIEARLRSLRGDGGPTGDGFTRLLGTVAPLLAATPGVTLQSLYYRDGALDIGLGAGSLSDIDGLRLRLRAEGLDAAQGATRLDGGAVSGTLTVRGNPSP
jgi:general secretion pathway protein L